MKKKGMITPVMVVAALVVSAIVIDADAYGNYENRGSLLPANTSSVYQAECGSCHFAYQPGLLPARSWQKIMDGLDHHFGDNAELNMKPKHEIEVYLQQHAVDVQKHRKSDKLMRGIASDATPLRISALPYMQSKHDEIPSRLVAGNAKVGSLANCAACHTTAANGNFDDDDVIIPDFGRWED